MGGYGLIGEKLAHSYSPQIHALLGDYQYRLIELGASELDAFMRENDLDGFNVTIPYKESVLPYMAALSPAARRIGSVNTVLRLPGGGYFGDNTDYYGFSRLLGDVSSLIGREALVLGGGGASRTVRVALADAGLSPVVISRRGEDNYQNLQRHAGAALVVNATPVGMYPHVEAAPLDIGLFPDCRLAIDLIYNPARTRFLLRAEELGIPARNGLLMLAAQAARGAELFDKRPRGEDEARRACEAILRSTRNIALIGMPGCGKTTVGRALAALSGRRFFDADAMVAEREGLPIAEIFARRGEAYFRLAETRALREAARESGAIIATGGGAVKTPENLTLLRQNSAIIHITRPLAALDIAGRPLSLAEGPEALWRARAPLYAAWSDKTYENDDVEAVTRRIWGDWL